MYKILFVDDERNILDYLPLAIDWESLGITQMYTADSARHALRIVKNELPDIAVVDVEMPEMDGLEFCREAQKLHPQIKFIILSAFDRFEYAKESILIGVDDYLLKPVDEEELLELMRRVVEDLEKICKDSEENRLKQVRALEKALGDLLQDLLHQKEPLREWKDDFPMLEDYENLCIAMQGNQDERECGETLEECLGGENMFIALGHGFYAVLWKGNMLVSMEQKVAAIRQAMEREGFHVWMCYVRIRKEENAMQAMARCFCGLEKMFYAGYGKKRLGEQDKFGQMDFPVPDLSEGLRMLSEDGNVSTFQSLIYQAMDDAFAQYGEPIKVCGMVMDFFIVLKIYLTRCWQEDAMDIFRKLNISMLLRCGSPENLYALVGTCMEELQLFMGKQKKEHGSAYIVRVAKEYTKKHYQRKDLSLQEVSDAIGISRTYFSKAFKEMTGEKYWDYLSAYRIKKAKELLCSTNLSQAEISERVGYGSEFHFSRKFKEISGISPNKYRRSGQD